MSSSGQRSRAGTVRPLNQVLEYLGRGRTSLYMRCSPRMLRRESRSAASSTSSAADGCLRGDRPRQRTKSVWTLVSGTGIARQNKCNFLSAWQVERRIAGV